MDMKDFQDNNVGNRGQWLIQKISMISTERELIMLIKQNNP
jgi:hypothetical protein